MKPSSSTWTSWPSIVVTDMSRLLLAGHRQVGRERHGAPREQDVPVDPPERELPEVVDSGLLEQAERADHRERVLAGQRLDVVAEVDEHGPVVARLDEAVR